jgi:hypothetical protein
MTTRISPKTDKSKAPKLIGTMDCRTAFNASSSIADRFAFATLKMQYNSPESPTSDTSAPPQINPAILRSSVLFSLTAYAILSASARSQALELNANHPAAIP